MGLGASEVTTFLMVVSFGRAWSVSGHGYRTELVSKRKRERWDERAAHSPCFCLVSSWTLVNVNSSLSSFHSLVSLFCNKFSYDLKGSGTLWLLAYRLGKDVTDEKERILNGFKEGYKINENNNNNNKTHD